MSFCGSDLMNTTSSCGLLVREQESEIRCKLVSCSEKHDYTCGAEIKFHIRKTSKGYQ